MTLVINIGSTNTKYSIFDNNLNLLSKGKTESIESIVEQNPIEVIIVRIVFGGVFCDPIILNLGALKHLSEYNIYAPLHNPIMIDCVTKLIGNYPDVKFYGVFDSAFYKDMSESEYKLPLPNAILKKNPLLRRFGYHGFSHQSIDHQYQDRIKKDKYTIISCHLGGGSSITAIINGKPVATSMGFGPEEGLVMVKRTGDIGANLILTLIDKKHSTDDIRNMIYKESGILGISGSDEIKKVFESSETQDILAYQMFINSIEKYLGYYIFKLDNKIDAVILTGGIGENSSIVQNYFKQKLSKIGIDLITLTTNEELEMIKAIRYIKLI